MRDAVTYIVIWAGDAFWWPYLYTKIASLSKVTWPRIGNYKSGPEWKWLKLSYQNTFILECIQLGKFDENLLGKTKWTLTGEVSEM